MPIAPTQIVSFFLEKYYILHSAVLPLTNMLRLCQITPKFWSRCRMVAIFAGWLARVGFRLQNETLFATLCGYVGRGQQGEIERIHPPPTNRKNRLKSFCEVGYANFKPNVLKNIYRLCNVKRLEKDIKSRCNPHFLQNA